MVDDATDTYLYLCRGSLDEENTRLVRRVEEMGQMERTREQMVRDAELMHAVSYEYYFIYE